MLRAGPFSDEAVVRLVNRRFVPFFFDLSDRGAAGDRAARRFVVAARAELGGRQVPTPPVLIMTPEGEVVGECSNYASTEQVLTALRRSLREHPKWNKPSATERAEKDPLARAEIRLDLFDHAGALAALKGLASDRARYLRGHIERLRGNHKAALAALRKVQDGDLADDVRMERAHIAWHRADFERMLELLKDFPADSDRYAEARYHEGLARYHLGDVDAGRAVWKAAVTGCSQSGWVYRADWAYCESDAGKRAFFSTSGKRTSLLGRIGYMGRGNPDLIRRSAGRR